VTASKKDLEDLHAAIARQLTAGITERDENGKLNASLINVARQFLKDNGIEAKVAPGTPLEALKDEFPFADNVTPIKKAT
jgi:hypothetical protein